jgi:hypothetical protein
MPDLAFKGSALAKALSDHAVAHRRRDPSAIESARRNLAEAKVARYIEQVVSSAPPFTPEQVDRLRVLLEPARSGGGTS